MGNQKLDSQDIEYIIKKAGEGETLVQIQNSLLAERNIDIKSRQTIANVLKKKQENKVFTKLPKQKPQTLTKPISRELKTPIDESPLDDSKVSNSESSTETNRKGVNFDGTKFVSVSSIYNRVLEFCQLNRHQDDICATLIRHSRNKKKSWRRIVMDTIDILIRMGVLK